MSGEDVKSLVLLSFLIIFGAPVLRPFHGMAVLGFLTVPAGPARTESEGSHSYTISFS